MIAEYVERGVAAGTVVGIAYGLYMLLAANPLSEYVHDAGHDHGHEGGYGHDHAEHVVSETTTAFVSAGSGLLWAIFLGGCFAVALYLFEPAVPGSEAIKPYVVAAAGFLAVSGIPWLVLPPAAPGAEHLYAVELRLVIYVGAVIVAIGTIATAVTVYDRFDSHHVALGLAGGSVPVLIVVTVLVVATPTITTHPDLAPDLVAAYQGLAVLSQATLWLLLAVAFDGIRRRAPINGDQARPEEPKALVNQP